MIVGAGERQNAIKVLSLEVHTLLFPKINFPDRSLLNSLWLSLDHNQLQLYCTQPRHWAERSDSRANKQHNQEFLNVSPGCCFWRRLAAGLRDARSLGETA